MSSIGLYESSSPTNGISVFYENTIKMISGALKTESQMKRYYAVDSPENAS